MKIRELNANDPVAPTDVIADPHMQAAADSVAAWCAEQLAGKHRGRFARVQRVTMAMHTLVASAEPIAGDFDDSDEVGGVVQYAARGLFPRRNQINLGGGGNEMDVVRQMMGLFQPLAEKQTASAEASERQNRAAELSQLFGARREAPDGPEGNDARARLDKRIDAILAEMAEEESETVPALPAASAKPLERDDGMPPGARIVHETAAPIQEGAVVAAGTDLNPMRMVGPDRGSAPVGPADIKPGSLWRHKTQPHRRARIVTGCGPANGVVWFRFDWKNYDPGQIEESDTVAGFLSYWAPAPDEPEDETITRLPAIEIGSRWRSVDRAQERVRVRDADRNDVEYQGIRADGVPVAGVTTRHNFLSDFEPDPTPEETR